MFRLKHPDLLVKVVFISFSRDLDLAFRLLCYTVVLFSWTIGLYHLVTEVSIATVFHVLLAFLLVFEKKV